LVTAQFDPPEVCLPAAKVSHWWSALPIFFIFLAVALILQVGSGAYEGAFAGEPDEAAHYVTALMIRDYVAQGFPSSPIEFAKEYYLRYPRVAFGLWPPLFHGFLALWMLLFGTSQLAVLPLFAILSATFAFLTFSLLERPAGRLLALIAGLVMVSLPAMQASASQTMLDLPLAIIVLLALKAFANYLETDRVRDAALFGILAAAALLTKYNALALALLPLFAIVFSGQYARLKRMSFWTPLAIVLLIAGPWYVLMYSFIAYAAEFGGVAPAPWATGWANFKILGGDLVPAGFLVFLLALAGLASGRLRLRTDSAESAFTTVSLAWVASAWTFHSLLYPLNDPRYFLPVVPSLLWLTCVYAKQVVGASSKAQLEPRHVVVAAMVLLIPHVLQFKLAEKSTGAFVTAIDRVLRQPLRTDSVVLVAADVLGESAAVAEAAMRAGEKRIVLARASKMLASSHLMGTGYRPFYRTPEAMMAGLDAMPASYVVVQDCPAEACPEHRTVLRNLISSEPRRFERIGSVPSQPPIHLYRLRGNEDRSVRKLTIDMGRVLGSAISLYGNDEQERARTVPERALP
jgi:hypothetical protein